MTDTTHWTPCPEDLLPRLTYQDLWLGLESISQARNRGMIPYLVSALREQAPYPYRTDGSLRDPSVRQLPRRRTADAFPPQLTTPSGGMDRLLLACLLALGLIVGLPAALKGAVALQKTVESLQPP